MNYRVFLSLCYLFILSVFTVTAQHRTPNNIIDSSFYQLDDKLMVKVFTYKPISNPQEMFGRIEVYEKFYDSVYIEAQVIDSLEVISRLIVQTPMDYNNDGLNDLRVLFGSGARGANGYYHIFLQSSTIYGRVLFTTLKGAKKCPNLIYNADRGVIEGARFYGGTTFEDYKIVQDSLVEIYSIDVSTDSLWTIRSHYIHNNNGHRVLQRVDSVKDGGQGLFSRE